MIIATSLNASAGFFDKVTKALDSDSSKSKTASKPLKEITVKKIESSSSYADVGYERMFTSFEPFYIKSLDPEKTNSGTRELTVKGELFHIPENETLLRVMDDGYVVLTDKHAYLLKRSVNGSGTGYNQTLKSYVYESIIADSYVLSDYEEFQASVQTARKKFAPIWKKSLEKERSGEVAFKPCDLQWGDSIDVLKALEIDGISWSKDGSRPFEFRVNDHTNGFYDPNAGVYRLRFLFASHHIDKAEVIKNYTSRFGDPKLQEDEHFKIYTWEKDGVKTVAKIANSETGMIDIDQHSIKYNALHEEFLAQGKAKENEARKNATSSALGF